MRQLNLLRIAMVLVAPIASADAAFDACKDILHDGLRDEIVSRNSVDHKIARHEEFCSIAKKHNLRAENFREFAQNYANTVTKTNSSTSGGASVGYGPFSFGANFAHGRSNYDQSADGRRELLERNKSIVLDYFTHQCGNASYGEHLSALAQSVSRIANSSVIEAWRSCMKKRSTEFYSYLVHDSASSMSIIVIGWRSGGQNVQLQKLEMSWPSAHIAFSGDIRKGDDGIFSTSQNLCDMVGGHLFDGDEISFPFKRLNKEESSVITINSCSTVGNHRTTRIAVPKEAPPVSVVIDEEIAEPTIDTAAFYYVTVKHSSMHLHVEDASTKNLARISQQNETGLDNQKWQFESAGDGYYYVRAKHSRKYLDVDNSGTANLQKIHQYEFRGTDNQKWKLEPAGEGYFYFVAKHSGKVLDVDRSKRENLVRVQQYERRFTDNQKWKLTVVQ